jgi:hypothetical protein
MGKCLKEKSEYSGICSTENAREDQPGETQIELPVFIRFDPRVREH